MTTPLITLGMATHSDFNGAYFSVQALRMYQDLTDCEIIVVDNKPDSEDSKHLQFIQHLPNCRLINMPEQTGTAQPRNRVFAEAQGEYVVCMDSHVLLRPDAVQKLKNYFGQGTHNKELVSGPILWDTLFHGATHFDDYWRSEMWGIWGQAWACPCGQESYMRPHFHFAVLQDASNEHPNCRYRELVSQQPVEACTRCGRKLPALAFNGHDQELEKQDYRKIGIDPNDPPFEVPAQGLGLFACRKDFWNEIGGFNPAFRGFGGEEMYIHEKVRRHGGKVMCLPFLGWGHRFARVGGVKFPLTRYQKVRNYVLGAIELAQDSADEKDRISIIEDHFVKSGLMSREQWDKLLADPKNETIPPECESCNQNNGRPLPPIEADTPQQIAEWCQKIPRDLEKHIPKLAEYAAKCQHATEFTERRESTVGLLAGVFPHGKLVSYNTETDRLLERFKAQWPQHITLKQVASSAIPTIEETDLLFLDSSPHNFNKVWEELNKFAASVRKYIILHDTVAFGQGGEGGGPGLHDAMKQWIAQHPEWFVGFHTNDQYGLTVLSKVPEEKPEKPIVPWPKGEGPGTELKAIMSSLGVNPGPSCDCNAKARQMDDWGVDGCREHFQEIVEGIKANQQRWGWQDAITNWAGAAVKAVLQGIIVNPLDPIPGLIRLAIKRAEEKEDK